MIPFPDKKYDIIYADPPWHYYGDPNKDAAAGKHYNLMTAEEIRAMPVKDICKKKSVLFLWATCPKLDVSIDVIRDWGFHYRGVAWVWVKTRQDGAIINGQGVRPSFVKPTTELLLCASTSQHGRVLPILDESLPQVVLHHRLSHSEKPQIFRDLIVRLHGDNMDRIELFARTKVPGWDRWGNQAPED